MALGVYRDVGVCEYSGVLVRGLLLQVEAGGLYGELREWLPGPSRNWRLLRRDAEVNT